MFSSTSRDFPKKLLHMLSPGLTPLVQNTNNQLIVVANWTGALTKMCASTIVILAGRAMYAKQILKDINSEVKRLSKVHPFKFSKARDGGNRPRIFCFKGARVCFSKDTKFRLFYWKTDFIVYKITEPYPKDFCLLHCLQQARQLAGNRELLFHVQIPHAVFALFRV